MKLIPLTKGKFAQVDDIDFDKAMAYKWQVKIGSKAWLSSYAQRTEGPYKGPRKCIKLHRFILQLDDPLHEVLFLDSDGLNCQRHNLKVVKHSVVCGYSRKRKTGIPSSRYKGVSFHTGKNRWLAQITYEGKYKFIGWFKSEEAAAAAYDRVALKYGGDVIRVNDSPMI